MLNIKPVVTHLSIARFTHSDQLYVQASDGRCCSLVPDCKGVINTFCEKTAIRTLNRLAEALRKKGQIVQVDDTIPAKHEDAS